MQVSPQTGRRAGKQAGRYEGRQIDNQAEIDGHEYRIKGSWQVEKQTCLKISYISGVGKVGFGEINPHWV